jgi:hypothetical protein
MLMRSCTILSNYALKLRQTSATMEAWMIVNPAEKIRGVKVFCHDESCTIQPVAGLRPSTASIFLMDVLCSMYTATCFRVWTMERPI